MQYSKLGYGTQGHCFQSIRYRLMLRQERSKVATEDLQNFGGDHSRSKLAVSRS